MNIRIRCCK